MVYILTSIITFFIFFILHIIGSNLFPKYFLKIKSSLILYFFGLVVNILLINYFSKSFDHYMSLPWTSITVYILLTFAYLIFFFSPFLGEESPTSRIILILKRKKEITEGNLTTYFHNEYLIKRRLNRMIEIGWIKDTDHGYIVLSKGKIMANIIKIYRKILGSELSG